MRKPDPQNGIKTVLVSLAEQCWSVCGQWHSAVPEHGVVLGGRGRTKTHWKNKTQGQGFQILSFPCCQTMSITKNLNLPDSFLSLLSNYVNNQESESVLQGQQRIRSLWPFPRNSSPFPSPSSTPQPFQRCAIINNKKSECSRLPPSKLREITNQSLWPR